jgi:hypothetical protein
MIFILNINIKMSYTRELKSFNLENGWFYDWKYLKNGKEIEQEKYYNYVRRRLKKSMYPGQYNDFFLFKMPEILKNHPDYTEKEIPIDWLLSNIIKFFWAS